MQGEKEVKKITKDKSPQWFEEWKKDDSRADVAQKMIENFGLKSYHLERNRREAIEASEVYDDAEYTDDDIRQFIEFYYEKQDGQYIPYCKAIADCLQRMIL